MHPFVNIFGRDIPLYGTMLALGIGSALALVFFLCTAKGNEPVNWWDGVCTGLFAIAGGMTGAFLLRPVTRIPQLFTQWETVRYMSAGEVMGLLFGEIVFYGGLIGGLIAVIICSRKLVFQPVLTVMDLCVPALTLGHAFGRMGCCFGGCCYGVQVHPAHPFAVVYPPESLAAPPGIPLLAVPVIEAACLLIITAILIIVYFKVPKQGICAGIYLTLYPVTRFVIEFFRGDLVRGIYGGISTSQYISMGLFIIGAGILIKIKLFRLDKYRENI